MALKEELPARSVRQIVDMLAMFSRQIAPENLFPSAQVKETLARLNYLVRTRGFGLLTGEVGAGKSTAVRALSH